MSNSPREVEIEMDEFLRMTEGEDESIRLVTSKYDWNKVIDYMKQKAKPVTVGEIQRKVMPEVDNIRQIRAWMERQVKKNRIHRAKSRRHNRVFYVLRSVYKEREKKEKL